MSAEREYRPLLKLKAEQLLSIANTIRDPGVRGRIEQIAMDLAAEAAGGEQQVRPAKAPRLA